jgi:hypothetical protein
MPFDDEDLPVGKTSPANSPVATDDLDVDWGDQDAMTMTDGLERIVPADKNSKVRVAVIEDTIVKPKMAWLHFIEKDGKKFSYRCHSKRDKKNVITTMADCCKKLNHDDDQKAQLNVAVLAVKYTNADPKTGKYVPDADGNQAPLRWELGWLKLSRSGFKSISELALEGEKPHEFDFTIANRENKIGYDYKRISQKARYRANPELYAEVVEEAKKFADGVLLSKRLGKVITEVDMKALLAGKSAASKNSQIDNTDDL